MNKAVKTALVCLMLVPAVPDLAQAGLFNLFHHDRRGDGHYTNNRGRNVKSPSKSLFGGFGASAKCRDGSNSYSKRRSGSCSGHGGVRSFR